MVREKFTENDMVLSSSPVSAVAQVDVAKDGSNASLKQQVRSRKFNLCAIQDDRWTHAGGGGKVNQVIIM